MADIHDENRFPQEWRDLVRPIRDALILIGGRASREEIANQVVRALNLPTDRNEDYWSIEELSHRRAMRERRLLFRNRFDLAIRRLRQRDFLEVQEGGEVALTARRRNADRIDL